MLTVGTSVTRFWTFTCMFTFMSPFRRLASRSGSTHAIVNTTLVISAPCNKNNSLLKSQHCKTSHHTSITMLRLKGDWSAAEASTINVTNKTKFQNTSFNTAKLNGFYYCNTHQPNLDSWYVTHNEHLHAHIFLQLIPTQPPLHNMIHGLYHRVDGQLWHWLRSIRAVHSSFQ